MRALITLTLAAGLAGCTTLQGANEAVRSQSVRLDALCDAAARLEPTVVSFIDAGLVPDRQVPKAQAALAAVDAACAAPVDDVVTAISAAGAAVVVFKAVLEGN
ncbi:hypothetical protein [Jiella marina]|uniref:hypothetical protein n=1 Tax=Jiella sp. LLJ827 TaxID=2917712 RepID=UPI002101B206|nr:hypothetical protein [Jiella sp. LLJ827]MCQ0986386.1 hypothetical protein [Jiella sp. LLJ827]